MQAGNLTALGAALTISIRAGSEETVGFPVCRLMRNIRKPFHRKGE